MHRRRQELIDEWWFKACPARHRDLDLEMRRQKPPELVLLRWLLHRLMAARTWHGDIASYHQHFNHSDATLEYVCGQETSPIHFIRCQRHAAFVCKLRKDATMDVFISQLIGHNCPDKFIEFARATNCFGTLHEHSSSAGREENNWLIVTPLKEWLGVSKGDKCWLGLL